MVFRFGTVPTTTHGIPRSANALPCHSTCIDTLWANFRSQWCPLFGPPARVRKVFHSLPVRGRCRCQTRWPRRFGTRLQCACNGCAAGLGIRLATFDCLANSLSIRAQVHPYGGFFGEFLIRATNGRTEQKHWQLAVRKVARLAKWPHGKVGR